MSGLTRLALANRAVVVLATLVTIGLGLFCTTALRQELLPSLNLPSATVLATYPGASPEVIEREVTEPLETALKAVSGVTKVSSISGSNVSQITVEWEFGLNQADIESKVRTAMDSQAPDLPTDVKPQLISGSFDDVPVIAVAASSDLPPEQLAQKLKSIAVPALGGISGVREAAVSGEQVKEVSITTRQADLDRLDVDPSQLQQVLAQYKAVLPAGTIASGGQEQPVQVGKVLTSVLDVQNIQLQGKDGPVQLSSVADVAESPVRVTSISRVNGKPSLDVSVTKTSSANTVSVAQDIREQLPEIEKQIGSNTKFTTIFDQAPFIEQSIHDLTTEGGLGLVMAVLVILLFLWSIRPTVITAISIPLSLLITLIALYLSDYTLNLITLSALTVAVGRVVDDSIVVIENIERNLHAGEEFSVATIVRSVKEVAGAVTASTLTTVAVFAPISLVSGQTGEIFRPFGVTVTVALLASLFVALTIVPVLASWFMRPSRRAPSPAKVAKQEAKAQRLRQAEAARHEKEYSRALAKREKKEAKELAWLHKQGADEATIAARIATVRAENPLPEAADAGAHAEHESPETGMQRLYLPVLRTTLRHPILTILASVLIFAGSMGLTGLLKTDFIGESGQTTLVISQKLPTGTSLDVSDAAATKVEATLAAEPGVESYQATVGSQQAGGFGGVSGSNEVLTTVNLKPDSDGTKVMDSLRRKLTEVKDIGEIEVQVAGGGTGSNAIEVKLTGDDAAALTAGAEQVQTMLSGIDGLREVSSDQSETQNVLQVQVNEPVAARYGMSQATVGAAAAEAVQGTNLGSMTINGVERDIVQRSRAPLSSQQELENLPMPVTQQQNVDAQKAAADELKAEAEAEADEAAADQRKELNTSEKKLRDSRAQAAQQLSQLTGQLSALRATPLPPAGAPAPGAGPAPDPAAELNAQIKQLREGITQARQTVTELDEQISQLGEQREKIAEQQVKARESTQKQEDAQNAKGTSRVLRDVAAVAVVPAPATITREDANRVVTVSGTPDGTDLGTATRAVTSGLDELDLPDGVTASIGGVSQDQQEAFTQLFLAMAVAIALVYMIMVATFRSLLQPVILLVSVPFAATGAIGLLLLTGTPLGLPAMIGLLMLIGIVVTNAIVLIDLVNTYRAQGATIDDAVIHGARLRLRPIVMTALATIMALVPMALGLTGGGVFISKPLAIVVIGGLISSTLLTLILVPVLYHLIERGRERVSGWRPGRGRGRGREDEDLDGLDGLMQPALAGGAPRRRPSLFKRRGGTGDSSAAEPGRSNDGSGYRGPGDDGSGHRGSGHRGPGHHEPGHDGPGHGGSSALDS